MADNTKPSRRRQVSNVPPIAAPIAPENHETIKAFDVDSWKNLLKVFSQKFFS